MSVKQESQTMLFGARAAEQILILCLFVAVLYYTATS